MDKDQLDSILYSRVKHNEEEIKSRNYEDYYLEQYRMYLHIFNSTGERRNRSNEFFLGLNTAIIGIIGYLETKDFSNNDSLIFLFAPIIGVAICYCWCEIIISYRNLTRAKFKIIHTVEQKLPISLFETEWELLGKGKDNRKYRKISSIEKNIPIVFIVLYIVIFLTKLPWNSIYMFLNNI